MSCERTDEVCADIVDNDERARQEEPDETVEYVAHEETGGNENYEQDHVGPCILHELPQILSLAQPEHEIHETCTWWAIGYRARPAMVHGKGDALGQ